MIILYGTIESTITRHEGLHIAGRDAVWRIALPVVNGSARV
jgi:hypothetical protein